MIRDEENSHPPFAGNNELRLFVLKCRMGVQVVTYLRHDLQQINHGMTKRHKQWVAHNYEQTIRHVTHTIARQKLAATKRTQGDGH